MSAVRHNYHTHTRLCKHADGAPSDYAAFAGSVGLTVLGFADHTPLPDRRWEHVRMEMSELDGYCDAVDAAREAFPELTVLKGMECDHAPEYLTFYHEELRGRRGLDYLVGAMHWFPHDGQWVGAYGRTNDVASLRDYTGWMVNAIDCGFYDFIAHPDLFANAYLTWDAEAVACSREILAAAAANDCPLEINGYGFRKGFVETPSGPRPMYPLRPFWELATDYGIRVIVSSDAHRPWDVAAGLDAAAALATECGLEIVELPVRDRTALATDGHG